jgi:hypothetical protein
MIIIIQRNLSMPMQFVRKKWSNRHVKSVDGCNSFQNLMKDLSTTAGIDRHMSRLPVACVAKLNPTSWPCTFSNGTPPRP